MADEQEIILGMTKLIALSLALAFLPEASHAETTSRAFPFTQQVMITIYKSRVSSSDQDARSLFDAMNVPLRDSFLGPGKSIESADKGLSWVCGDKGGTSGVQCTLMLKASPTTRVGYRPIQAAFQATPQEAAALYELLHTNTPDGRFAYSNEEGTLKIEADQASFRLSYTE